MQIACNAPGQVVLKHHLPTGSRNLYHNTISKSSDTITVHLTTADSRLSISLHTAYFSLCKDNLYKTSPMPLRCPRRLWGLYEKVPKGLDWFKQNRSVNILVGLSRDLNTNVPISAADAEEVQASEESGQAHMSAPLPLSKTEHRARWITESAGCYICSLQKSWWPNQTSMTFFTFQKEEHWSSATQSGVVATQVGFFFPAKDKSTCNYKLRYLLLNGSLFVLPPLKAILYWKQVHCNSLAEPLCFFCIV